MSNPANSPGLVARLRAAIKAEGRTPGIDEVCERYACSRDHARKVLARLRYEAVASRASGAAGDQVHAAGTGAAS